MACGGILAVRIMLGKQGMEADGARECERA